MIKITQELTIDYLKEHYWFYNRQLSSDYGYAVYIHRFPVYRYKNGTKIILDCEFTLHSDSGRLEVNVYNRETGEAYAPYYFYEYGDYTPVLEIIKKNILKEYRKVGASFDHSW